MTANEKQKPKVLAIIAQKGGTGKSTIAVHLAAYAKSQNLNPVIIDLDPQGSAYDWNLGREEDDEQSPKLDVAKDTGDRLPHLLNLCEENGVHLVIIDTAPHSDRAAAQAAKLADFVLIPLRPNMFDLKTAKDTAEIANLTNTPAAILISQAPLGRLIDKARAKLKRDGLEVLPIAIRHRVAYSHALFTCSAVHEYEPDGKATEEISALWTCLKDRLGL
jgi:chromosome partitioning protein